MKKIIIYFSVLISIHANSQLSIESSFNSVHIGRNQNLLIKSEWNRISINFGIKYNFNKLNSFPSPQGDFYKKSFWALNEIEHWGIESGFQFKLLQNQNVSLFTFYNCQITHSHIRHEFYYALFPLIPDYQSEYDFAYERKLSYIGPIWAIENNFGFGMNAHFTKTIYLTTKIGGGILFHKNTDKNNIIIGGKWELSEMISMGLGWKFSNRQKK